VIEDNAPPPRHRRFNPHAYARRDWQLWDAINAWVKSYDFANPEMSFIFIEDFAIRNAQPPLYIWLANLPQK
jgi:hypothetical protein